MRKIELCLETRGRSEELQSFYGALGLDCVPEGSVIRLRSNSESQIVSVSKSRLSIRAPSRRVVLAAQSGLAYDPETIGAAEARAYRPHRIPFDVQLCDPLGNMVGVSPSLESKTIAVLTSGGDAPGMNCVVHAVVRAAARNGARTLGVQNGYSGLIRGEIVRLTPEETAEHVHCGGTFLRSARCAEFRTAAGMARAVANLKEARVDALVAIGGDGTMRGAQALSAEHPELSVVFVPGSIDNDIPGTDSVGAATALHRIVEAIDCIESTMTSHSRGFIVEVMGRNCGWLALHAALATDAAHTLLPERPAGPGWEEDLKRAVLSRPRMCTYVVLAEGAITSTGERITAESIRNVLTGLGVDSRSVVLGHTQRGGAPCAFDRILGASLGVAAAEVALSRTGAFCIYYNGTEEVRELSACAEQCSAVAETLRAAREEKGRSGIGTASEHNTHTLPPIEAPGLSVEAADTMLRARGSDFLEAYTAVCIRETPEVPARESYCVAAVGTLGAGADHTIAHMEKFGHVLGKTVHDISTHPFFQLDPARGGVFEERALKNLRAHLAELSCSTLVLIGGLDALFLAAKLEVQLVRPVPETLSPDGAGEEPRKKNGRSENLVVERILVIPCTISNNVPGTDVSIGADTALDTITALCDNLKINATRKVAYLVEVHGGACGYLCIATALAVSAIDCYRPEENRIISRLSRSARALSRYFGKNSAPQLIIRGNGAMRGICNDTAAKILETDGNGEFVVRHCTLGHVQKGNRATAVDRVRASKIAHFALKCSEKGVWVLGMYGWTCRRSPVSNAVKDVNEEERKMLRYHWPQMARAYRIIR